MSVPIVLQGYAMEALGQASYEDMEDGGVVGRVAALPGVIAFGETYDDCRNELLSVIEDWAWLGMQRGLALPVLGDVDLNTDDSRRRAGMADQDGFLPRRS